LIEFPYFNNLEMNSPTDATTSKANNLRNLPPMTNREIQVRKLILD
jgi:hypothetical protein